jgi:hypothetical protein
VVCEDVDAGKSSAANPAEVCGVPRCAMKLQKHQSQTISIQMEFVNSIFPAIADLVTGRCIAQGERCVGAVASPIFRAAPPVSFPERQTDPGRSYW